MTISTETSVVTYIGNGATISFTFSFVGDSADDIRVELTASDGTITVLDPSLYEIVLTPAAPGELWGIGGTVTYPLVGSPITSATKISIIRAIPLTQDVTISNQGAFYPQAVEQGLDVLEMQLQQVNTDLTYALKTPITDTTPPQDLPPAAERANGFLTFDSSGQPVISSGIVGGGGTVTSVGLQMPGEYLTSNTPITTSGTITVTKASQLANSVYAGPTTGIATTPTFRSLVPGDLPVATSSALGAVKPDNTTITVSGGVISAATAASANPTATAGPTVVNGSANTYMRSDAAPAVQLGTAAQKGLVQVDGSTITASSGVITAATGTSSTLGIVKPDNSTITISGGTLTATGAGLGNVSTTGSPASGNLTQFSGGTTITNVDLTGDVTTSGSHVTTLTNTAVTPTTYGDATHVAQVTFDSKGRATSASSVAITATTSSVALALDSGLYTVSGSPVTTTGTLTGTLNTQSAGAVFSGPTSGGAVKPTFRSLVATDLPGGIPLGFVISGKPAASQIINYPLVFSATMPTSLTGSVFKIGTNPTGTMTFAFTKNGSSIGSVAFSTLGVATVTFASPVSLVSGDILTITAPGSQDATGADIGLSFLLTRV